MFDIFLVNPPFGQHSAFDFTTVAQYIGTADYLALLTVALWSAYCSIILWRRMARLQFSNEDEQEAFLEEVQRLYDRHNIDELADLCEGDSRCIPQLILLGLKHRQLPLARLKTILIERFQRDVLAELDYRMSWIQACIKAAPMLGLLGTVIGMMGAFSKLSDAASISPDKLGGDIMHALITTACGLAIAIPLILVTASMNVRIGRLEDFIGSGLTRLLEILKR